MSKELKIMLGIAVVVIAGAAFLFIKGNPKSNVPANPGLLVRDNSNMTGDKNAKATLVEFGDFECPYCGALHPTIKQIIDTYKDNKNFNFVFRNFPASASIRENFRRSGRSGRRSGQILGDAQFDLREPKRLDCVEQSAG
jgi:hypothetical protein